MFTFGLNNRAIRLHRRYMLRGYVVLEFRSSTEACIDAAKAILHNFQEAQSIDFPGTTVSIAFPNSICETHYLFYEVVGRVYAQLCRSSYPPHGPILCENRYRRRTPHTSGNGNPPASNPPSYPTPSCDRRSDGPRSTRRPRPQRPSRGSWPATWPRGPS